MLIKIFVVTAEHEIVFASFSKDDANTYAERYNADTQVASDIHLAAIVSELSVPLPMLQRIPKLRKITYNYSSSELSPEFYSKRDTPLLLGTEFVDVHGMRTVRYIGDEYIFISEQGLWYLVDDGELVLPEYEVEQEIEAYIDVAWSNPVMNQRVVLSVDGTEYTRSDVFNACNDFLCMPC